MKSNSMWVLAVAFQIGFTPMLGQGGRQAVAGTPPMPVADPTGINKCRFISFSVPAGGEDTALRVMLLSLHHVSPPYTGGASVPFTAFEGQSVWVGPPVQYVESSATLTPFYASFLQCSPHYRDWSTVGLLHVTGSAIVPSSTYHAENVSVACMGIEGTVPCLSGGANVSAQLPINTVRWGDVVIPYNPPSTTIQPDARDISALNDKFRNALGAPIKARAIIVGNDAFGNITSLGVDLGFGHIAACIDAFAFGTPYPYKMGKCATGTGACTTASDCTGANAPPCNLYCP